MSYIHAYITHTHARHGCIYLQLNTHMSDMYIFSVPELKKQRKGKIRDSLVNQASICGKFQANEKLSQKQCASKTSQNLRALSIEALHLDSILLIHKQRKKTNP